MSTARPGSTAFQATLRPSPSPLRYIVVGVGLGVLAGLGWKSYHWSERTERANYWISRQKAEKAAQEMEEARAAAANADIANLYVLLCVWWSRLNLAAEPLCLARVRVWTILLSYLLLCSNVPSTISS